jgi:hypothetical protein
MKLRQPRVPESVEQAHIVTLVRSIAGKPYVLGTRRRKGDHQGTMQTPGIGDVYAWLPAPRLKAGVPTFVWFEVKGTGGRLRPEQTEFKQLCEIAGVPHVVGGLDAAIAFLCSGGWISAANLPHYKQPKESGAPTQP